MKNVTLAAAILIAAMVVTISFFQGGHGLMTCGEVHSSLAPCIPYLTTTTTGGKEPGVECCNGVRNIKEMAKSTKAEKRQVCICIKEAINRYKNLKDDVAIGLPAICGVSLDIPLSRNINFISTIW
ncbi:hypothetical protein M9H77_33504 [Catharanthus roseus]|uniref:Uncharacterized protein n=1 Tax=Catharanthus roseus TaxID=4058 RepID=A0ACB9ZJG7_CATRO|nr:hypothetical protein M9H77_33504 [Catharanthus roseus]